MGAENWHRCARLSLPLAVGPLQADSFGKKLLRNTFLFMVLSCRLNKNRILGFYSKADKAVAMENLEKLGIPNLKKSCYRELSGGQQQRVLLARALCATGKLILLDEPVAGLDPLAMAHMYSIIKDLTVQDKITVIMVSHDIISAVKYATHILHLCSNGDMFFGTTEEYKHSQLGSRFLYHNCHCDECEVHEKRHLNIKQESKQNDNCCCDCNDKSKGGTC